MKRFAGLYGMKYAGMATNRSEAAKLSKTSENNKSIC